MRSPKPQGWRGGRQNWARMTRSRSVTAGIALAFVVGDLDDGAAFIDRALVLNPNLACGMDCSAAGSRSGSVSRRWRSSAQLVPCA